MVFDDDDIERVIRPFFDVSKQGLIEGAVTKRTYKLHTDREKDIHGMAMQRLKMRRTLMAEVVAAAEERVRSMERLLDSKEKEIALRARAQQILDGAPAPRQIASGPPPAQASIAPMSVHVTKAQIQEEAAAVALGLANVKADRNKATEHLLEAQERLSAKYPDDVVQKIIELAAAIAYK